MCLASDSRAEMLQRARQGIRVTGTLLERFTSQHGIPSLADAGYPSSRSVWMPNDPATRHEQQIRAADVSPGDRYRTGPLAVGKSRKHPVVAAAGEWREGVVRRFDDLIILLRKLALQTVHMHVVNACESPECLPGLERESKKRVARQRAESIAVAMDCKPGVAPQCL